MFLYKTFWNLYKTEYFLYKRRRKLLHVFSESPVFFIQTADFLGAFPVFLSERVRFSRLPIRFLRVFSTLSVMILLFLFHQSVFFPYSSDKKSIFFRMNHPSGYASFLFSSGYFHIFSDAPADFSVLSRILFCIFPSVCEKICCFFSSGSSVF